MIDIRKQMTNSRFIILLRFIGLLNSTISNNILSLPVCNCMIIVVNNDIKLNKNLIYLQRSLLTAIIQILKQKGKKCKLVLLALSCELPGLAQDCRDRNLASRRPDQQCPYQSLRKYLACLADIRRLVSDFRHCRSQKVTSTGT